MLKLPSRSVPTQPDKFGQGNEVKLKFANFLDLLEGGSDSYYLTTQDVKTDGGGRPQCYGTIHAVPV